MEHLSTLTSFFHEGTLHIKQIHIPRDRKFYPSFQSFLIILMVQYLIPMMGSIGKPQRIFECLNCKPNEFSTWVYFTIILNALPLHIPFYLFLQSIFPSTNEPSIPSFSTCIFYPILKYPLILMYSPMSTNSGISTTSLLWTSHNIYWKPSSVFWTLIHSSELCYNTCPSNLPSSYINNSNHLPTHFLISVPES